MYALCLSCDAVVKRELKRLDDSLEQQRNASEFRESSFLAPSFAEPEVCGTVFMFLIVGFIFSLFSSGRNSILSLLKVIVKCMVCVLFLICGLCCFVLGYANSVEIVCVLFVR